MKALILKLSLREEEFKYIEDIYLGEKIGLDPKKIEKLIALKEPKTLKELQSLMRLFNYFRRFSTQLLRFISTALSSNQR